MDILIFAFEIIGTVAFSVSGAMTGLKKNMDIFGVMILGVVTAIGGGVTRDLILGITPPGTFGHPVYVIVATVTAIITFLPKIRRLLTSNQHVHDFVLLILGVSARATRSKYTRTRTARLFSKNIRRSASCRR